MEDDKTQQWDEYGELYLKMKARPIGIMQSRYVEEVLETVQGCTVLDDACGNGFYSRKMAEKGTADVIGIDVSTGMLAGAEATTPLYKDVKVRYFHGDMEQPDLLRELGLAQMKGSFDVVFAAWLLNHASDWQHMKLMFDNIFDALKPGGRFIGLTTNPHILRKDGLDIVDGESRVGDEWNVKSSRAGGYDVHTVVKLGSRSIEFDQHVLFESEYTRAAKAAGFPELSWRTVRHDR